jgi:hypothetical protein
MPLVIKRRTSDNSILNSVTRVADPVLQADLAAGAIYRLLFCVNVYGGTTGDVAYDMHYSGTLAHCAGMRFHKGVGTITSLTAPTSNLSSSDVAAFNGTGFLINGSATTSHRGFVFCECIVWTDTAGTISIRHAQNTLSNTAGQQAIIKQGSWLAVERVDAAEAETVLYIQKPNDEARVNTTALTADTDLSLLLAANTQYLLEVCLLVQTSTTPDFKFRLDSDQDFNASFNAFQESNVLVITQSTGMAATGGSDTSQGPVTCGIQIHQPGASGTIPVLNGNFVNAQFAVRIMAIVDTGANAPTLNIAWGPNALDAVNNTTVMKGSFIVARQVP